MADARLIVPVRFEVAPAPSDLTPFVFTNAPGVASSDIEFSAQEGAAYRCRRRVLLGGKPAMEDDRTFFMPAPDVDTILDCAKKRLSWGTIPVLFEHGFGAKGGEAGGKNLEFYRKPRDGNDDLWVLQQLDEDTWKAAVKPGLKWHSVSVGFDGWVDPEGFIRCNDVKEVSCTSRPAMRGLGSVETFEAFEARMRSRRAFVQLEGSGLHVPAAEPAKEETTVTPSTVHAEPTVSPAAASKPKEPPMTPLALALLGLAPGATPEQFEAALIARFGAQGATTNTAITVPAPVTPDVTALTAAVANLEQSFERRANAIVEQVTRTQEERFAAITREREIDALITAARTDGRLSAAEEPATREVLAIPAAFEIEKRRLLARPKANPTRKAFSALTAAVTESGAESADPVAGSGAVTLESLGDFASEVIFVANELGCTMNEAAAYLRSNPNPTAPAAN